MSQSLAGKTALVTGGSRGIGRSVAERLAQEGATVAVTYHERKDGADETVARSRSPAAPPSHCRWTWPMRSRFRTCSSAWTGSSPRVPAAMRLT